MDAALAFAAELEERDAALAGGLAVLVELGGRADALRVRAEELAAFLALLPSERQSLEEALMVAAAELEQARGALTQATRAAERAGSEDARAVARRREAHVASNARFAIKRLDRLSARSAALESEASAADAELVSLDGEMVDLAAALRSTPRLSQLAAPAAGLDGAREWSARAHAAVVLACSGLETERERVVREANELAASVLGEPLSAASVATVRQRLAERGA